MYYRQNVYNRESAVNYAIKYALSPNPNYRYFKLVNDTGGDCANFISQCLKAGGAQMSHNWWYQKGGYSISWVVANSLYRYLKTNNNGIKAIEVNDLDKLELGDIIQYENFNNRIFHSAIITSFTNVNGTREPLISQHSYDKLNVTYKKSYPYKMAHFLKIAII